MERIAPLFPVEFPRILVPVDCSPESRRQVELAARLAAPMAGVRVTLMATMGAVPEGPDQARLTDARHDHAMEALKVAADQMSRVGTYCLRTVRTAPSFADGIVAEAATGKYHMITLSRSLALRREDEENPCAPTIGDVVAKRVHIPVVIAPED